MLFIPENELEKALVKAVKDPAAAPDFYRLLLTSDLLVLGTAEGQEGAREAFSLEPGSRLKLVPGVKEDGGQYLPVFSSLRRMQDFAKEESKYLTLNGHALLDLSRGAPIILNPASEYGKELSAREVQTLLDGPPAVMGTPEADYPIALVKALTGLFKTRTDIAAAWMIQVTFPDRAQDPHPLVGIETAGDWPSLLQAIEAEASIPDLVFDIERVDRQNPSGMTKALLQVPPFYRRPAPGSQLN